MSEHGCDASSFIDAARDALSVRRVFGDAYQRDGVLVIPVARVCGGIAAGAGDGHGPRPSALRGLRRRHAPTSTGPDEAIGGDDDVPPDDLLPDDDAALAGGSGGGGMHAVHVRPLGVYVVDAGGVHWQPTVDVNRAILVGQVVGAWVLTVGAVAWACRGRGRGRRC